MQNGFSKARELLLAATLLLTSLFALGDISLEQCLSAAHDNYPLIKEYNLLVATENINLDDINKGWLPKIGLYAQGSIQNVVPSFPSSLSNMMSQMGGDIPGLGKFQYKIGADISQTIWDGGAARAKREISRLSAEADKTALDVELYGIRERVESIYFAILLMQEQIEQTQSAIGVYDANIEKLRQMLKNGVAMQCDIDMLEAQRLTIKQQLTSANSAISAYRNTLSIFTGLDLKNERLLIPSGEMPSVSANNRPELSAFNAQQALNNSRINSIEATLMPKIGFFTQTYYGYPGIDYFKAMMKREPSFNILAGVKVTWNVDAFYTKKNSLRKIEIANRQIDTRRAAFLFNTSMQSASKIEEIKGIEAMMRDDSEIIRLRQSVRKAAESQLRNGIVDATALTSKINDETQASLNAAYHSILRLQAIYNLKNTLNQ